MANDTIEVRNFDFGRRKHTAESSTKRNVVFFKLCPIFRYEIVAKKPISQLIEDCMKPNWGTGSQDLENICKIILSHTMSHFQFVKLKFSGPKFYSFELDEIPLATVKN